MKVCKPFGPNLLYEKTEYDTTEPHITKEVPYLKQTLDKGPSKDDVTHSHIGMHAKKLEHSFVSVLAWLLQKAPQF